MNDFVRSLLSLLPDRFYLDLQYYSAFRRLPNWRRPVSFNEKIQWLKLYDHNPAYISLVDKYAVKKIVAKEIGEEHIIPTLGVWDRVEDIEWGVLPEKYVLKTTHGGGNNGVVICRGINSFDREEAIKKLSAGLRHDSYLYGREWPYKYIHRRIIAEQLIEPRFNTQDLPDYKWYCFNGVPKYCQVIQNRSTKETIDFFDTEWRHQEFIGLNPNAIHSQEPPSCPPNLGVHLQIARKLSKNIPFSRIDLYETGDNTYFGEITLYPNSGLGQFSPKQYGNQFGQMIVLPIKTRK